MPRYQGELDGLCGLYAVANAFEFCFSKGATRSFEICCRSLARSRWPCVLWEGTTFGDVMRMIAAVRRDYKLGQRLKVHVPFLKSKCENDEQYWETFDYWFDQKGVQCALMGISKPFAHWIIATSHKSGVLFLDSTAGETLSLVRRDRLRAGKKRTEPNQWLLDPRELIFFEKDK